jgi:multimeric flavodoxin WrbA
MLNGIIAEGGDDMQNLYPALEQAEVILFAVPIYWWHMNAQTKLCIDRLTALLSPDDKLPALEGKRIVLVVFPDRCLPKPRLNILIIQKYRVIWKG